MYIICYMMRVLIRKKKTFWGILLVVLLILSACKDLSRSNQTLYRLEQDLFSLTGVQDLSDFDKLKEKYPVFFPLFCSEIIGIGSDTSNLLPNYMNHFLRDPVIISIKEATDSVYPDLLGTAQDIHRGIDRFEKTISRNDTVKLISYISGFNQSFVSLPGILGLGLDNYLGANSEYYQQLAIPKYVRKTMDPEFLAVDAVRAWIMSDVVAPDDIVTLLDHMIHEGKILYLLKESISPKKEYKIFRYSKEQLEFCIENERSMWEFIIENELLYSSDHLLISRMTKEAPFIREFGTESPGRVGSWLGFRIVQRYMKRTGTAASDLILMEDSKTILSESRYRPG